MIVNKPFLCRVVDNPKMNAQYVDLYYYNSDGRILFINLSFNSFKEKFDISIENLRSGYTDITERNCNNYLKLYLDFIKIDQNNYRIDLVKNKIEIGELIPDFGFMKIAKFNLDISKLPKDVLKKTLFEYHNVIEIYESFSNEDKLEILLKGND